MTARRSGSSAHRTASGAVRGLLAVGVLAAVVLAAGPALADVPVALPASERAVDWTSVLALGDLAWGTGAAPIQVSDRGGGTWVIHVAVGGAVRTSTVARPVTPDSREDLVWLLVSLLADVEAAPDAAADLEPEPEPAPAPVTASEPPEVHHPVPSDVSTGGIGVRIARAPPPAPAPAPATAQPPAPEPPAPEADPLAGLPDPPPAPKPARPSPALTASDPPRPPRPPKVRRPVPPPQGVHAYGSVGARLGLRVGLVPALGAELGGGVMIDHVGLGLGGTVGPRTPLPVAGADRSFAMNQLFAEVAYASPPARLAVDVGAELRRFREAGEPVSGGAMPFVRLSAALAPYVGRHLWLEPSLAYKIDLGNTEIRVDGAPVQELPTSAFEAAVTARVR